MHVYGMHKLMLERGRDNQVNIGRRNSIQQVVDRLLRDGYIEIDTDLGAHHPRRTIYRPTSAGRALLLEWLRDGLAVPQREYPDFPVVVSNLAFLTPDEVVDLLVRRRRALEEKLGRLRGVHTLSAHALPAVLLLESTLDISMTEAELDWVNRMVGRIRTGELVWKPGEPIAGSTAAEHLDQES